MAHALRRASVGIVLSLAMATALAAGPTLRMASRPALSEEEQPRVHAPDAGWLSQLPRARTIELTEPSALELLQRAVSDNGNRRSVGFGRDPDLVSSRVVAGRGESALRFSVRSASALHVRTAIRFADAAQYRITSYRPGDEPGAVSLYRKSSGASQPLTTVWTPVSDGDTQEIVVERLGEAAEWSIEVARVSHFDRSLRQAELNPDFFGASAPCQVDMACVYQVAPTAMQAGVVRANFAVALMIFTKSNGLTYSCTGTLLNSVNFPAPIFLTAHHCLDDPQSLASLTTTWSFNRTACRSGPVSSATTQVAGGATSLFGSADLDAALIQLNQMPPAIATYLGWDASTMQPGTSILAIHHPEGDVKKASFGIELGVYPGPLAFIDLQTFPGGTFHVVSWDLGIIEPGSSGSGLLSFDPGTGSFFLRGTLTGGLPLTCNDNGKATTYYARFDNLYPHIQSLLTQSPPAPATTASAVEYYFADWDFYFETSFPNEIAALDGGAFGGAWKRTGETFNVWPQPIGSASPTCRFFSTIFDPKSSHFYTPFDSECASLKAGTAWQFEGIAFYIQLADDNGLCPPGTIPLYRAYNNGMGGAPNHRYTTSLAILNRMLAAGWLFEGNGVTEVFACVPA